MFLYLWDFYKAELMVTKLLLFRFFRIAEAIASTILNKTLMEAEYFIKLLTIIFDVHQTKNTKKNLC